MKPFFYILSRGLPVFILISTLFLRCESYQEPDIQLGKSPDLPTLSVVQLKTDSNRIVVSEKSDLVFDRLWSAAGASLPERRRPPKPRLRRASRVGGAGCAVRPWLARPARTARTP